MDVFSAIRRVGVLVSLLLLSSGCARSNAAKTQVEALADWGATYGLTNGKLQVHVSPEIGRVMHFSRVGEPNLLWTSPVSPAKNLGGFPNYGGDKLWPWPQGDAWGWPPPKAISEGPYINDYPACATWSWIQLKGPLDDASGLVGRRWSWFEDETLVNSYTLRRETSPTSEKFSAAAAAAWSVVQVQAIDAVYARLLKNRPAEPAKLMEKHPVEVEAVSDRWLKVTPNYVGSKVGLAADLLAVRIGDRFLVIERTEGNDDPDLERAVAAQIYFHAAPNGSPDAETYVELELIGPTRTLKVGQAATLQTRWHILTPMGFESLLNAVP